MKSPKMTVKIVEPTMENRNQICPFDFCHLYKMKTVRVYDNRTTKTVKTYICPACYKKYIHEKRFPDMQIVGIGGQDYFNLNLPKEQLRVRLSMPRDNKASKLISKKVASATTKAAPRAAIKSSVLPATKKALANANDTAGSTTATDPSSVTRPLANNLTNEIPEGYVVFTKLNKVTRCVHPDCYSALEIFKIKFENKKKKAITCYVKKCPNCNQYYLPISAYNANRGIIKCLNEKAVLEYEKKLREQQEKTLEASKQVESKALVIKPIVEPVNARKDEKNRPVAKAQKRVVNEFEKIRKEASKVNGHDNYSEIHLKDFVIKRNSFRCVHSEHALKDISASITIINQKGNFETMKVPAGYCKDCNVYFIFDDVYKRILSRGTPICRMYDWKAIESGSTAGNMMLAQESLLRQYGYNVNANEGLSSDRRKRILQILVDNHIMTKSEIVSYLKFFISQRKNNSSMKLAVEKWNSDKAFIENYKIGSLQNYYVGSLKV